MVRVSIVLCMSILLTFSPLSAAKCPDQEKPSSIMKCTSPLAPFRMEPKHAVLLRFRVLWQLDLDGIHPPLRLPYSKIQQLEIESMWGLEEGESLIRDPRWDYDKLQPELQAIARLLARETAMTKRIHGRD